MNKVVLLCQIFVIAFAVVSAVYEPDHHTTTHVYGHHETTTHNPNGHYPDNSNHSHLVIDENKEHHHQQHHQQHQQHQQHHQQQQQHIGTSIDADRMCKEHWRIFGNIRHPHSCQKYIHCHFNENGQLIAEERNCGDYENFWLGFCVPAFMSWCN